MNVNYQSGAKDEYATLPDGRRCARCTTRTGRRSYLIFGAHGRFRSVPLGAKDLRARIDEAIDRPCAECGEPIGFHLRTCPLASTVPELCRIDPARHLGETP